jgi:hypothetical protein
MVKSWQVMGRLNSVIRIAATAVMVCAAIVFLSSRENAQSQNAFVPFIAHIVEEHFASAAATIPASVSYITVERKTDGSEATSTTVDSPERGTVGDILDVASFKHIALDSLTDSAMTFYLSANELRAELNRRHCPDDFSAVREHSTILGYEVVRYRASYGSKRRDVNEEWMAPALACFVMKGTFTTSGGAWNRRTVVSLTKGQPSPSMFTPASNYIERSPAQLEQVYAAKFSGAPWLPPNALENVERNYDAHRANR